MPDDINYEDDSYSTPWKTPPVAANPALAGYVAKPDISNTTTNTASQPIDIGFGPNVYTTPDTLGKSISSGIASSGIGIGNPTATLSDIGSLLRNNAGLIAGGATLANMLGGNKVTSGGYQGSIPNLVATRMQVPGANDPYRVPGSSGRQYFTDTLYTDPSQAGSADAVIRAQAQAIAANQPNAPVPSFAMPWNKQPGGITSLPATQTQAPAAQPQIPATSDLAMQLQNAWSAGNVGTVNNLIGSNNLDLAALQKLFPQLNAGGVQSLVNAGVNVKPPVVQPPVVKTTAPVTQTATTAPADPILAAYNAGDYAKAQQLINAQHLNPQDIVTKYGLGETDAKAVAKNLGYTGDMSGLNYGAASAPGTWDYLVNNVIGHVPAVSAEPAPVAQAAATPSYYGVGVSGGDIANFVSANMGDPAAIAGAMQQYGLSADDVAAATGYSPQQVTDYLSTVNAAQGGMMGYARGGIASMGQAQYLQGSTDGMADKLPTSIDGVRPAKLSHGEFVVPADVVSHLGNGNSDAGAKKLYQMMDRIRMDRTGTKKQGKEINPDKYMPGGQVGYAGGGAVAFVEGGQTNLNLGTSAAGVPGLGSTQSSTLSPWAGDYVTNMLGKAQALTNGPMPVYQGPLSAGQSALQNQQFAGLSQMAQTGYDPTTFTSGTFDANQAQQYMNPYLSASLAPQLSELQRQAQINNANDAAKLTGAGAYGGGRQAILMGEQNRNLLDKSNQLIGSGYNTAYNNAMSQFNADQARQMQAQQGTENSRQFSANTGIQTLKDLGAAGATQRDIAQQGIAADLGQYKEQQAYPYQQLQFQQSMLQNLPISTAVSTANTTPMSTLAGNVAGYTGLSQSLANLGLS